MHEFYEFQKHRLLASSQGSPNSPGFLHHFQRRVGPRLIGGDISKELFICLELIPPTWCKRLVTWFVQLLWKWEMVGWWWFNAPWADVSKHPTRWSNEMCREVPNDLSHVPCRCPISRDSRSMGTFSIPSPPKLHCYHQLARAVDLVPVDKYHIIRKYHVLCSMSLESEADLHWFQTIAVGSICKVSNLTSRRPFAQYRHERSPHPYETSGMACLLQQTPPGCQRWKNSNKQ